MNLLHQDPKDSPPLIALVGPTASGKSDAGFLLALELESRGVACEIVSADSMQVYRHMNIGTAKPGDAMRRRIAHHMLDIVEPTENFNVSRFQQEASKIIRGLLAGGRGAIVVGGTGLYVKALVDGLNEAPAGDLQVRSRLEAEAEVLGGVTLYERLQEIDPEAAEKIHPHNIRRVVRALEVYEMSGTPFSQFHRQQKRPAWAERFQWFGLSIPLDRLDRRIEERTRAMFQRGLIDEVQGLLRRGCGSRHTALQGLGYKEVVEGLAAGKSEVEMEQLVAQRTRRYARRQLTWWRPEKRIQWLDVEADAERPARAVQRIMDAQDL